MRQNEDMRKISAWVAIAAVSTLIAGIYGMNFKHMPELDWTYGYPFALGLMAALSCCCTAASSATTGSRRADGGRERVLPTPAADCYGVTPSASPTTSNRSVLSIEPEMPSESGPKA